MNTNEVSATIEKRGEVYGDPRQSHTNIGLSWTALIQQHYGITLDHPLPVALVAQMMVTFKMQRACRVYHRDNYVDAAAYLRFAEEFQAAQLSSDKSSSVKQCAPSHDDGTTPT